MRAVITMMVETNLPLGTVDPGLRKTEHPLDLTSVARDSRTTEDLGYDGLGMTETKDDPFVVLSLAASSTEKIHLTSAVAIAFARSPTAMAMSAWSLQKASRGRFTLGLGTQVKGHIERRFGLNWSAPGPWIEEYVRAVRAVWNCWQNGADLDFHGEHYNLTLMNPLFDPGPIEHPQIPIHVAAVNPYMARIAGRVADGVRPHPICTRKYLETVMRPAIDRGIAESGRQQADVMICAHPLIVTAPGQAELEKKVSDVRARIAFYASTRAYRAVWDAHDWGDIAEHLSALAKRGRWAEMERHITDEMVDTVAVVGSYDQIAARVRDRYAGIASQVKFGIPLNGPEDAERLRDMVAQIRQTG